MLLPRLRSAIAIAAGMTAFASLATAASADDDFLKRFTISVVPNYQMSTTGDANAPAPAGFTKIGYTKDHPVPNTTQLDYGAEFEVDRKTRIYYSHSNFDYAIGRVFTIAPKSSFVAGEFGDHTDTVGVSRQLAKGLSGRVTYFNQVRSTVTGLCLNQTRCGGPNPAAIASHGYGVGATYNFGPKTRIGSLFSASVDAKYVTRPSTAPDPGVNLGGLGHYVGSQVILPYSLTAKIPVLNSTSVIPVVGYERAVVLYRNEATPEMFNVVLFGVTKVVNKNLSFGFTNLNLVGCRCSDTVPTPDNVRISQLIARMEYKTSL